MRPTNQLTCGTLQWVKASGARTSRNRGLLAPHRLMQYQRTTVARRSCRQPRYGQDGNKRAGLVGVAHQCATNTHAEPKSSTTMRSRPLSAALRLNALRLKVPCARPMLAMSGGRALGGQARCRGAVAHPTNQEQDIPSGQSVATDCAHRPALCDTRLVEDTGKRKDTPCI